MAVLLSSGRSWEEDPGGNRSHSHGGRTDHRWLRDRDDHAYRMIAKNAKDPVENYSIGMGRVAYVLSEPLELPVPSMRSC